MTPVISVENLSKRYILSHQSQERYTTLRNVMANGAKRLVSKLSNPLGAPKIDATHEEFWALKDVSFDIQQGDRVGIIGRNGAGKSTLLKILSRITEPTSGKISIKGRVASLLEVGTGFHPELTGRENIFLNGAILGMRKAEISRKFDEIVAFAEVEKFLDTPVKRYSSGMYVRLAFAVAAHLEPEVLIVDEVLAVGDAQFQKKCLGKMEEVGKEGRTVLFVSHNIAAIKRLCTSCVYLDRGEISNIGPTSAVVESYLNAGYYKQSGEVKFNGGENDDVRFISARIADEDDKTKVQFRSDEDVRIIITYEIKRQLTGVSLGIHIFTGEQESLWSMNDWDTYPDLFEKREPGIWTCEWILPANVLKPASYFIYCGAGNFSIAYHHPDPFLLEIMPEGSWRASYQMFGVGVGAPLAYRMAVVRPTKQFQENFNK